MWFFKLSNTVYINYLLLKILREGYKNLIIITCFDDKTKGVNLTDEGASWGPPEQGHRTINNTFLTIQCKEVFFQYQTPGIYSRDPRFYKVLEMLNRRIKTKSSSQNT